MQVSRSVLVAIEAALVMAILAAAMAAGWWLFSFDTDAAEVRTRAEMARLQASAQSYFSRLHFYDGLCADIGVPAGWRCHNSDQAYAIEADIGPGSFFCLDSSGYLGHSAVSKGAGTRCVH